MKEFSGRTQDLSDIEMLNKEELKILIEELRALSKENEWAEFKESYYDQQLIGEYLSALSNSACLENREYAYHVFGKEYAKKNISSDQVLKLLNYPTVFNLLNIPLPPNKDAILEKLDKVRAYYQHSSLKYVSGEYMSNQSLRERFDVDKKNYPVISRIIRESIEVGVIKEYEKSRMYIPFWAG